jgi:hypothetical protein
MSYTYNETQAIVSGAFYIDAVRFLVADTDVSDGANTAELSDEIITAKYTETASGDTQVSRNYQTAIKCAEYLYVKYSKLASFTADGVTINYKDRADMWLRFLNSLRNTWLAVTCQQPVIYASRPASYRCDGW